jgi:hypothetical protein
MKKPLIQVLTIFLLGMTFSYAACRNTQQDNNTNDAYDQLDEGGGPPSSTGATGTGIDINTYQDSMNRPDTVNRY